jgi:hypothetical protein
MKRRIIIISLPLLLASFVFAQADGISKLQKVRNIIWFTPNEVNKINGVAIGLQAMNVNGENLSINGLNADIALASVMCLPYIADFYLKPKEKRPADFMLCDTADLLINGISISMAGELGITVNGLNIAGGITGAVSLNGISITGLVTRCNSFKGLTISGIHNYALHGIGLQVGVFNYCKNLKGLQIGLWNKNGKRGLPFINWRA